MTGLKRQHRIGGIKSTPSGTTSQKQVKWREHVAKERRKRRLKLKLERAAARRAAKELAALKAVDMVPEVNPSPALVEGA